MRHSIASRGGAPNKWDGRNEGRGGGTNGLGFALLRACRVLRFFLFDLFPLEFLEVVFVDDDPVVLGSARVLVSDLARPLLKCLPLVAIEAGSPMHILRTEAGNIDNELLHIITSGHGHEPLQFVGVASRVHIVRHVGTRSKLSVLVTPVRIVGGSGHFEHVSGQWRR